MAHTFIRKKVHNRFARKFPSANAKYAIMKKADIEERVPVIKPSEPAEPAEPVVVTETVSDEKPKKKRSPRKKKKSADEGAIKEEKEEADMDNIEKIKKLVGDNEAEIPARKVRVEKKDKGLFERTENSTILLTEDNKMVLND